VAPFAEAQARQHQKVWADHLGVDVEMTNSIGMKLALIPPGEFRMGSERTELDTVLREAKGARAQVIQMLQSEHPQHRVRISRPFYLGVYEVTQMQYERVMGVNPSYFSKDGKGAPRVLRVDTSDLPVEQVSWEDASKFCRQLNSLDEESRAGRTYRLPTEAEWEYACRAGTTSLFHFGSVLDARLANSFGTYGTENRGPFVGRPAKVGQYVPNAWGLHNVHGNVCEWCADRYHSEYYANSPTEDPGGPEGGLSYRVNRGGSWSSKWWRCRSALRHAYPSTYRGDFLGFRVVLESPVRSMTGDRSAKKTETSERANLAKEPNQVEPGMKLPDNFFSSILFSTSYRDLVVFNHEKRIGAYIEEGRLRVVHADEHQPIYEAEIGDSRISSMALSGDAKRLAWATSDTIYLANLQATRIGEHIKQVRNPLAFGVMKFSYDGRWLAFVVGEQGRVLDALRCQITKLKPPSALGRMFDIAVSERFAATRHTNGKIAVWDPTDGSLIGVPTSIRSHDFNRYSLAFSDDGRMLTATSKDGLTKPLWVPR